MGAVVMLARPFATRRKSNLLGRFPIAATGRSPGGHSTRSPNPTQSASDSPKILPQLPQSARSK